jgi:hypothetical protein
MQNSEKNNKIDDGGFAFPRPGFQNENEEAEGQDGMSLRDYFAAKAMNALLIAHGGGGASNHNNPEALSKKAYKIADAMIRARKEADHE